MPPVATRSQRVEGQNAVTLQGFALELQGLTHAAFCPDNAVVKLGRGNRFRFNYDYCKGCGMCVGECPCGAIEMVAETI
jgi:ferredoxin